MKTMLTALSCIILSVAAQFAFKAGTSGAAMRSALAEPFGLHTVAAVLSNTLVLCGFVLYGLSAATWISVLAKWDVSKAYPLVGLGFVLTAAVGWATGEQVGWVRVVGIGLIAAGVMLVGRS